MYLAAIAITVSMLLGSTAVGAETGSLPTQQYSVLCRCVDADGNVVVGPRLTLFEGEKENVAVGSQSPFVIGFAADEDGVTQPQIAVIDEGTRIEVTAFGRQANGATMNVVVEQSEITNVEIKKTGPDTFVQVPRLDTRKKRVIDFVKFGEVLTIPAGEKGADGITPRVELVVCGGNATSIPSNWTSPVVGRNGPRNAEREGIFNELLATGAARVRCERVSHWEKFCGHGLYADLLPLRDLCDLADLYCACCPHRFGLADALCLLAPAIDDPTSVRRLEESLLGYDWGYSVELAGSPSLPSRDGSLEPRARVVGSRCRAGAVRLLAAARHHESQCPARPETLRREPGCNDEGRLASAAMVPPPRHTGSRDFDAGCSGAVVRGEGGSGYTRSQGNRQPETGFHPGGGRGGRETTGENAGRPQKSPAERKDRRLDLVA